MCRAAWKFAADILIDWPPSNFEKSPLPMKRVDGIDRAGSQAVDAIPLPLDGKCLCQAFDACLGRGVDRECSAAVSTRQRRYENDVATRLARRWARPLDRDQRAAKIGVEHRVDRLDRDIGKRKRPRRLDAGIGDQPIERPECVGSSIDEALDLACW